MTLAAMALEYIHSAHLLLIGSECLHGWDQTDWRLTSSALGSSAGEDLRADDAAALRLGAEA